jgi:UDP-glucose 4-epimerase
MPRVLVTGGAGFIGSHLCNALVREGENFVVSIDNLRSGDWGRVDDGVKRVECDIAELGIDDWVRLLDGVDFVYHLAAEKYNSSKSTPEKLIFSNVLATERLARAASFVEVKRVVFTSSLYAYGSVGPDAMKEEDECSPDTLYGASKLMGEGILRSVSRQTGISWNVARLFFVYGPKQFAHGGYKSVVISNFERLKMGMAPIIRGDGLQALDYVYIDDCVAGLRAMANSAVDMQVTNIASGTPISINHLTEKMIEISESGKDPIREDPDWTKGTSRWGSTANALSRFDFKCSTPIFEGLKNTLDWMRSNG